MPPGHTTVDAVVTAGGKGGLDTVAAIKIWQEILGTETRAQRQWEEKWGLYKAPVRKPRASVRQRDLAKSSSTPALTTAGREVVRPTGSAEQPAEQPGTPAPSTGAPTESNLSAMIKKSNDDRFKVLAKRRLPPKDRFRKPQTSNHDIGWLPNLEFFGVSQHGIVRDHTLKPEM